MQRRTQNVRKSNQDLSARLIQAGFSAEMVEIELRRYQRQRYQRCIDDEIFVEKVAIRWMSEKIIERIAQEGGDLKGLKWHLSKGSAAELIEDYKDFIGDLPQPILNLLRSN